MQMERAFGLNMKVNETGLQKTELGVLATRREELFWDKIKTAGSLGPSDHPSKLGANQADGSEQSCVVTDAWNHCC